MPDTQPQPFGENLTEERYLEALHALETQPELLTELLSDLHPSDMADLLERLPPEHRRTVIHFIEDEALGDTIAELNEGVQGSILEGVSDAQLADILPKLNSDDAIDIIQHLNDERAEETLSLMSDADQQQLMGWPEDSAGGLMQLEVLALPKSWRIGSLLDFLRSEDETLPDHLNTIYVVESNKKLIGSISLGRLVRTSVSKRLKDVMRTDPVQVSPDTHQRDVVKIFEKYDVLSCAVVDDEGQLLGVITIDDVMDALIEEEERTAMRRAGMDENEDLFAPVMSTTRKRFPWLVVNLFTAILASAVISLFEGTIEQLVALAVLMPIVASMGGNAATQTMTVTVRGLAADQITLKNALILLKKELKVGGFNGLFLGILVALGTMLYYGNVALGLVILLATVANHIFAALAGHFVPILLQRLGKDPAISSGVLVTTVTDVGGFFAFLGLAALVLL